MLETDCTTNYGVKIVYIKSIYLYDIENLTMQCDNVKPHMLYMWHHTSTILHDCGGPPGE